MHEWLLWKLIYTPIDYLFPTNRRKEATDEDRALAVIKEPDWKVLRQEPAVAERESPAPSSAPLNYTWVRP